MRALVVSLGVGVALASTPAWADANEVTTLETQLGKEATALSTSDCAQACRALASIRRAADRICELEPGPRCDAARTKADESTRRVREACPECAIAQLQNEKDRPDEKRAAQPAAPVEQAVATNESASSPRGGCRNCATASGVPSQGDFAVLAIAIGLLGHRLRRRPKKDRTRL